MPKQEKKSLEYRLPLLIPFGMAVIGMFSLVDLSLFTPHISSIDAFEAFADSLSAPAHWSIPGYLSVLRFQMRMSLSMPLVSLGTSAPVIMAVPIAIAAWAVHVIETFFAVRLCRRHGASLSVTLRYAIGVFFGGVCQFAPLKRAVKAI